MTAEQSVGCGQVTGGIEEIEGGEHGENVTVTDAGVLHYLLELRSGSCIDSQAKECPFGQWDPFRWIGCGIKPEPTHSGCVAVTWSSAVVVYHVMCALEVEPVFASEDFTPWATTPDYDLEATHFLHAIDLTVGEVDVSNSWMEPIYN